MLLTPVFETSQLTLRKTDNDESTKSLNTHYYVILKNPRDKSQTELLARQIFPSPPMTLVRQR